MKRFCLLVTFIYLTSQMQTASAIEPVYADTSVPRVLSLSGTVVSQNGLPHIQIKTLVRTYKNPAKVIRVTFVSTAPRSVLEPPCQGGVFVGSYLEGPGSNPRDIKDLDILIIKTDGDWTHTEYQFIAPLNDKVNQNNYPYCRSEYKFLQMYIEDIARHYTNISTVNGQQGQWPAGFGQMSNVWEALPSSATCPRYSGYPNDAIRSVCDVPTSVLSTTFRLADSDWINAATDLKAKQEAAAVKAAADKAAADKAAADKAAADKAAADKAAADKAVAGKKVAKKKMIITCTKGKLTKKVTAVKPKCPAGYKVKK